MKLTAQIQILPDTDQRTALLDTFEKFNAAANLAAEVAFRNNVFSQPAIHKRCYFVIRAHFGLSAQLAVRAIGKAVEAYRGSKKAQVRFKKRSAIVYDSRVLSIKSMESVSLSTTKGRLKMPFVLGAYQKARLHRFKGQADLVFRKNKFFILLTIDLPERAPIKATGVIGVDLGIVNIATDSEGNVFSGRDIEVCRQRYSSLRVALQKRGTKSAKRHLKKAAGKEANFRRDRNHCISKTVVTLAKDTGSAVALEDLRGIRQRTTVHKSQRARHSGWSFLQLRAFIEYKATLNGIPVFFVAPRNTSRICSQCGHCEKANRENRDEFLCRHCGYSSPADLNAARNIRARAMVNLPIVGRSESSSSFDRACKLLA